MNKNTDWLLKQNSSAFYVFDIVTLKRRITSIRNQLPESISLCYAMKANPFIVKEIKEHVERFEICSPGEAEICKKLGIPHQKMVISGIYKTPQVIEKMVSGPDYDSIYTAESLHQYELLCKLSLKYKRKLSVLLRLTNGSQFGMNDFDIENIVEERKNHPYLHICGIQFFSGTQITSTKKYKREIEYLDEFLLHLKESHHFEAEELEYGPGFPVSYFVSDDLDEEDLLQTFSQLINDMKYKTKITLELGRSIAASCGKYYTHIVDMKQNKNQNYLLVDGGMHQIVYFGQHMAMKQPIMSVCGKEDCNTELMWTICGSLCSMNDIIAKQVALPDVTIGDVLCFENTGAYCMAEGISLFLSRDLPAVYLILDNNEIILARESYETMNLNMPNYERKLESWKN